MTGKRFSKCKDMWKVFDWETGETLNFKEIINLLNELYEEKEMWKGECERLKGWYYLENEKDEHLSWKRIDVE